MYKGKKVGLTYNIFNGYELLEHSIRSFGNLIDYVAVVYQSKSNFGNPADPELIPYLKKLKKEGLVDELFLYNPNPKIWAKGNELIKRNIGLKMAKRVGCDYHMTMDSDELYESKQIEYVLDDIIENDYDSTACQMITYYKDQYHRLDPKEDYYVSLFHKVDNREYVIDTNYPVLVDPSRKIPTTNFKKYTRDKIEMHHLSFVRKDISSKFNNASSKINFPDKVCELVEYFNNWKEGMDAYIHGKVCKHVKLVKVNSPFEEIKL